MLYEEVAAFAKDNKYAQDICFCTKGKGVFYDKIAALGYKPYLLGMWSKYNLFSSLIGAFRLRRIIKNGSYDIIHMQEAILPFPFLAAACSNLKIRLVLHNPGEFHLTDNKAQWLGQQLKKFVYWLMVGPLIDVLVCNSNYVIKKTPLRSNYKHKLVVIHNAIDMKNIEDLLMVKKELRRKLRSSLNVAHDACIVTVVARLVGVKRIDRFIKAIALLNSKELNVTALIVGEGSQRSQLEDLAKQYKCGNIIFTGYRPDAKEITAGSDMFVLPSSGEAFGISALEALALNVPLLVFEDAGGPLEFVIHEKNGFIVKDEKDLCEKMIRIIDHPSLFAPSIDNPLIDREIYDMNTYSNELKKLYQTLT